MLISLEWLKELVKLPHGIDAEEIGRRLSLATVEVESARCTGTELERVVVGKVLGIEQHPNAERLFIVRTDVGAKQPLDIVCGGSNLQAGQKVAVARVGARVKWHGQGEIIELKSTAIRGVKSEGMICSSTEIGLGDEYPLKDEKEILDISHISAAPGTALAEALGLGGTIYEIDNKSLSHRPDLWGYIGIAREVSAIFGARLNVRKPRAINQCGDIQLKVSVRDTSLCPRYMAVAISGVKAAGSPYWMQRRLRASGIRPINVIVDVTNYVMLETGQPMHAFDYEAIKDKLGAVEIIIRRAHQAEEFTALDKRTHTLRGQALVIANKSKILALAGVIGGDLSAVNEATHTIILESATFNAQSVRRASNTLGLRTESSARFEKGLDTASAEYGLRRAVELYMDIFPQARAASKIADGYVHRQKLAVIELGEDTLQKKLGASISLRDSQKILERLGFDTAYMRPRTASRAQVPSLRITVPSFRSHDVLGTEDIIEEIVRIYGYERIPSVLPRMQVRCPERNHLRRISRALKMRMALECGFHEAYTYAFVRPQSISALWQNTSEYLELAHPLSSERPYLARMLAANLLESAERASHTASRVALFEIAPVFLGNHYIKGLEDGIGGHLPYETAHFACVYTSHHDARVFSYICERIGRVFMAEGYALEYKKITKQTENWQHPHKAVEVFYGKTIVGYIAALNQRAQSAFGLADETIVVEIDLSALARTAPQQKLYYAQPQFPPVARDIAFVVDESTAYADVAKTLLGGHPLVHKIELFDVYRGGAVGAHKKSFAFHIFYQSENRTLTAKEADAAQNALIAAAIRAHHAEVR